MLTIIIAKISVVNEGNKNFHNEVMKGLIYPMINRLPTLAICREFYKKSGYANFTIVLL